MYSESHKTWPSRDDLRFALSFDESSVNNSKLLRQSTQCDQCYRDSACHHFANDDKCTREDVLEVSHIVSMCYSGYNHGLHHQRDTVGLYREHKISIAML